ncbi:discoidin domain-containing protein [Pelagimonas varians]|uniref:NAD glycohydrolase translocation F5/8 type C domain-containing protein n=1 Tax=Pelagimonas varians TaxID=696760 RepID=A0A238L6R1_9RHOB|nr:discoidin domain-containing protein [Pelagimonas varians]PYG26275.1 hypothetical protein C8N36_12618 [Pelagimonas varians]SMX50072.1 hypothetical protein PEV8663_04471 [Pelagimonas varians]
MINLTKHMTLGALLLFGMPVFAGQSCAQMGATELVRSQLYCASSVLAPQSGNTYGPENLFDGNFRTAWCEGVAGNGEGQEIYVRIEDGIPFRRLLIHNGYAKSTDTYRSNGRARSIDVLTDRGDRIRTVLPDTSSEVVLNLPGPIEYHELRIRIVDVYPGAKYQDTCINLIIPDFEYERSLEFQ